MVHSAKLPDPTRLPQASLPISELVNWSSFYSVRLSRAWSILLEIGSLGFLKTSSHSHQPKHTPTQSQSQPVTLISSDLVTNASLGLPWVWELCESQMAIKLLADRLSDCWFAGLSKFIIDNDPLAAAACQWIVGMLELLDFLTRVFQTYDSFRHTSYIFQALPAFHKIFNFDDHLHFSPGSLPSQEWAQIRCLIIQILYRIYPESIYRKLALHAIPLNDIPTYRSSSLQKILSAILDDYWNPNKPTDKVSESETGKMFTLRTGRHNSRVMPEHVGNRAFPAMSSIAYITDLSSNPAQDNPQQPMNLEDVLSPQAWADDLPSNARPSNQQSSSLDHLKPSGLSSSCQSASTKAITQAPATDSSHELSQTDDSMALIIRPKMIIASPSGPSTRIDPHPVMITGSPSGPSTRINPYPVLDPSDFTFDSLTLPSVPADSRTYKTAVPSQLPRPSNRQPSHRSTNSTIFGIPYKTASRIYQNAITKALMETFATDISPDVSQTSHPKGPSTGTNAPTNPYPQLDPSDFTFDFLTLSPVQPNPPTRKKSVSPSNGEPPLNPVEPSIGGKTTSRSSKDQLAEALDAIDTLPEESSNAMILHPSVDASKYLNFGFEDGPSLPIEVEPRYVEQDGSAQAVAEKDDSAVIEPRLLVQAVIKEDDSVDDLSSSSTDSSTDEAEVSCLLTCPSTQSIAPSSHRHSPSSPPSDSSIRVQVSPPLALVTSQVAHIPDPDQSVDLASQQETNTQSGLKEDATLGQCGSFRPLEESQPDDEEPSSSLCVISNSLSQVQHTLTLESMTINGMLSHIDQLAQSTELASSQLPESHTRASSPERSQASASEALICTTQASAPASSLESIPELEPSGSASGEPRVIDTQISSSAENIVHQGEISANTLDEPSDKKNLSSGRSRRVNALPRRTTAQLEPLIVPSVERPVRRSKASSEGNSKAQESSGSSQLNPDASDPNECQAIVPRKRGRPLRNSPQEPLSAAASPLKEVHPAPSRTTRSSKRGKAITNGTASEIIQQPSRRPRGAAVDSDNSNVKVDGVSTGKSTRRVRAKPSSTVKPPDGKENVQTDEQHQLETLADSKPSDYNPRKRKSRKDDGKNSSLPTVEPSLPEPYTSKRKTRTIKSAQKAPETAPSRPIRKAKSKNTPVQSETVQTPKKTRSKTTGKAVSRAAAKKATKSDKTVEPSSSRQLAPPRNSRSRSSKLKTANAETSTTGDGQESGQSNDQVARKYRPRRVQQPPSSLASSSTRTT